MLYSTTPDPYLDPDTGVLKNLLGITSTLGLEKAEADITAVTIALVPEHPIPGNYDLAHLQRIHKELFGSIYPWAGEIRQVEMVKGTTRFANSDVIQQAAKTLFDKLHAEKLLIGLPFERYVERLAHYYSEINILHPFREGNGRVQRTYFTLLASEAGYNLYWDAMNADENLAASITAYDGEESQLVRMMKALLKT